MADKLDGQAHVTLNNRTTNIIFLKSFKDVEGKPVVLGIEADRGVVNAPQPSVTVTAKTVREMKGHKAFAAMTEKRPYAIEVGRRFTV